MKNRKNERKNLATVVKLAASKKRKLTHLRTIAGLVLTEALVSIASLTLGVMVLGTIITNAVSTTQVSKDYLLAQNLVTEAIETVKNIRDTNWLLQPTNRNCWLVLSPITGSRCGTTAAVGGNYIAVFNNPRWILQSSGATGELDLAANIANLASQESYRLYIDSLNLSGGGTADFYRDSAGSGALGIASDFYRNIKFTEITDSNGDGTNDFARLEIIVEWLEGSKVRNITRDFILYNYLE